MEYTVTDSLANVIIYTTGIIQENSCLFSIYYDVMKETILFSRWCKWIFLWTTVLYLNSLPNSFVLDDREAILSNSDVIRGAPIRNIFRNDFWGSSMSHPESHKSYRPITILSFRLQFDLHGLSPIAFHLVNVLLHSILTLLFISSCFSITKSQSVALLAGLLFGVHPIHAEAVTGVVGRAEILSGIFYVAAFLSYLKSESANKSPFMRLLCLLLSVVFVFFSLLSKEQGITILGLFVVDALLRGTSEDFNISGVRWVKITAILLSGVIMCYWRVFYLGGGTQPTFKDSDNPAALSNNSLTRTLTYSYLGALNLWLLLCPYWLCCDWSMGSIQLVHTLCEVRLLATVGAMLLLAAVAIHSLVRVYKDNTVLYSLLLMVLPYIPASNLLFPVGFVIAERVLYLPSMGFHLLVSIGALRLIRHCKHRLVRDSVYVFLVLLVLLHSFQTLRRNSQWYSEETLSLSGLKINPTNAKLLLSVGNDYAQKGLTICEKYYRAAIELRPNYEAAWSNLGFVLFNMNRSEEAEQCYLQAVAIKWDHVDANINYAHFLRIKERWSEAGEKYQIVLNRRPNYGQIRFYQAIVQRHLGNVSGAEREFKRSLQMQPNHVATLISLGEIMVSYTSTGEKVRSLNKVLASRLREAAALIRRAIDIDPLEGGQYCGLLGEIIHSQPESNYGSLPSYCRRRGNAAGG